MSAGEDGFEVTETQDGATTVLALSGELDLVASEPLSTRLTQLREAGTPVFLDLSGLAFIDSSGLACITQAVRESQDHDWSLSVGHELQDQVKRLLELVDGQQLFWPNGA